MPPPSGVFPALFDALRDRLAVHVSSIESVNSPGFRTPLTASSQTASDTLLTSLTTSDPTVHRCIIQEIRHNASANKLTMLRRKRVEVRRTREVKRRQKQRLNAVAAAERDAALLEISAHDHKFQLFLAETHAKASVRLQTLLYECIAEMKKALIRMDAVAADTTEESESMVEDTLRRYEWQLFLSRLQQDWAGDLNASLMIPGPSHDCSDNSFHSTKQARKIKASVSTILHRVFQEHGPAMEKGQELTVRSVVSLRRAIPAHRAKKSSRLAPSLQFGVSVSDMWTEVLEQMMSRSNPSKPRRVISSTSTRRIRRLPSSRDATAKSNFFTCDGTCSVFRQLASEATPQFPVTACDVPLSSISIRWMLPTQYHSQGSFPNDVTSGRDWLQQISVADCNIYFDIAEYEQKFATIMQNYATSAVSEDVSSTSHAALASARRSLRQISAILERSRDRKEGYSADTIFATRKMQPGDDTPSRPQDPRVFARASVLQLVQTLYYSTCFLTLMPEVDVAALRKLYPSALFGGGCLTTLYVPVITCLRESERHDEAVVPPSKVSMLPLNDRAIHELLLVYVARGRHGLTPDSGSNQQLTSLALSDAVNTLLPSRQTDSNQLHVDGARFCVIKNFRGLWKQSECWNQSKYTREQDDSDELQGFRDADFVFVECEVSSTLLRSARQFKAVPDSNILELLGPSCMWRSCMSSQGVQDNQNDTNFCMWHASVQRFIEVDESMQYTPNESRMKEAMLTAETDSLVDKTKRVIQTANSLLELLSSKELSSRHLPHSIKTFYEHVVNTASNRAYQEEVLRETALGGIAKGIASISDLEKSHQELQRLVSLSEKILDTENCATRELKQLLQLTVYPGVEDALMQHDFFDVEELQSDIRTRDLKLLLRLSQQKLQILVRRRRDEENQVAQRLATSTSLPSMSFRTVLEQASLNNSELGSSVYAVIHVMRKGRQSLLRQQHRQGEGIRHGSK